MAPLEVETGQRYEALWDEIRAAGYVRIRVDGLTCSLDSPPEDGLVEIVHTTISGGWVLRHGLKSGEGPPLLTLLTDVEIFGTSKRRVTRARRHASKVPTITPDELTPGQYVVHIDHGIARFVGTTAGAPSTSETDAPVAPAAAG